MDLQTLLANIYKFIDTAIIPLLIAIAFFIFLWNIARYFIIGGANEESQEKARSLAMWGIAAFVVMLSIWGIVNLLIDGLDLKNAPITPDYMQQKNKGNAPEYNDFGDPNPSVPFPVSA